MKINSKLTEIYKKDVIKPSRLQEEYIRWFDSLQTRYPLSYYLTNQDIQYLYKCAVSPSLNCNVKEKYHLIGELMKNRGFELIGGGTNRRAYKCTFENVVLKIATDQVGFTSNLREVPNQHVIKPFCTKIFCTDYNGIASLSELFIPFKTQEEFAKYWEDIFNILYFKFRNNDIGMEDIGTRSFKNWGLRNGFGPGVLDFPTMYVMDPTKRFCRNIIDGKMCGGTLDYDDGFNVIVCSCCGRTHFAKTLAKKDGDEISNLLQAVGYQNKKMEKELSKMTIILRDVATGEGHEIVIGGKSNYVAPNGKKRKIKPIINLNDNTVKSKKTKSIGFSIKTVGVYNPETGCVEKTIEPIVDEQAPFFPEVTQDDVLKCEEAQSTQEVPSILTYCFAEDCIVDLTNKHNTIDDAIVTFEELEDNSPDYDTVEDPSYHYFDEVVNDIIETDPMFNIDRDVAFKLYKELCEVTINIDIVDEGKSVSISHEDMIHDYDNHILINNLLSDIYAASAQDDYFKSFYDLINTVKNSTSFFMSLVGFYKTAIDNLYFDKHEVVGGSDEILIYKDVLDDIVYTIRNEIDCFMCNISDLVYYRKPSFKNFRAKLADLKKFDNENKANETTETDKYYVIGRTNNTVTVSLINREIEEEPEPVIETKVEVVNNDESDEDEVVNQRNVGSTYLASGQFDSYSKMSRKQRRKFDRENKRRK